MAIVAVIDTSQEITELLQQLLEDDGLTVVTAYTVDFKDNPQDIPIFFQTHRVHAVVYHIALPYVQNWAFFREHVLVPGYRPESCFVVTTTNTYVLEALVGSTHEVLLVERPFDLDMIAEVVRRAADAYYTNSITEDQQALALGS